MYNLVTPPLQAWHLLIALHDAIGQNLPMQLMRLHLLTLLILLIVVLHKTKSFLHSVVGATPLPLCQA